MTLPAIFRLTVGKRVFGLDALRAFAILMVMVQHSSMWVSPRFTFFHEFVRHYDGVAIFFVLSGFLIGGILIRTLETNGAKPSKLWDFWVRRWIRTIPPYFLALLVVMPLELRHSDFSASTYEPYFVFLQNFNWTHPPAFLEAWSLAVEEWFYLLSAPMSFLLTSLLKPRFGVLLAAGLFLVGSTAYRYHYLQGYQPTTWQDWDAHFRKIVLLRLDSLMYGVLAAWVAYYHRAAWLRTKWPLFMVGFIGLSLIANPVSPTDLTLFTCVFSFSCASLGVACMLPVLSEWKQANGLVANTLTHISLISYSLYLLHGTVVNFNIALPLATTLPLPHGLRPLLGLGILWVVSLPLATLMYKHFEVPVMNLRTRLK
ncbi:acyltransferase [Hymenobacter sp. YC55]|uniref:acyltransferase family protein n=1 Tax=Hymenobacter sp. YC55 TaxID=3034019 RepID=UPI0023F82E29|nr:acyltransferase [Hymenobacter sp. YC55]MDF7812646.1 acyltransferase [Hymenobacter sp. YC55]